MALTLGSSFGFQSTPTSGGGGGNSVIVKDEGVTLTSALASLNFVGAGVTASAIGNDVTVTINGGSGSGDLKADGTIPLTANWNVGAYEITANKFIGNNGFGFNVGLGGSLVSASTTGTAKTWTLPNTAGTIALTTDIPSLSGYLKADGTIPLTANWNVGAFEITANKFIGNNGFGFNVGLGGSLVSASTTVTAKTWTLPNITGTIALLESPAFTGYPTTSSPPSINDSSSIIPNTAWVKAQGYSRWFGIYNASTNTFTSPYGSVIPTIFVKGDFFTVSVAGVGNINYGGSYYNVGDVWTFGSQGEDDLFLLSTSIQTGTLSDYSSTTGTILPTDSVVSAISKLNGNIATGSTSYGAIFSQTTFNFLT